MNELENTLRILDSITLDTTAEINFFSVGGTGYLENPTSDLLALFMGAEVGVPRWLAKALMACLVDIGAAGAQLLTETNWDAVTAEREVIAEDSDSDTNKRLDLILSDGNFVLGIENKVYASAHYNPFKVYDTTLQKRAGDGSLLKCVLRASNHSADVPDDWPIVSYSHLVDKALAFYGEDVGLAQTTKWQFFYREFLLHLRALSNPYEAVSMSEENMQFVVEHFHQLCKAKELLEGFEAELKRQGQSSITRKLASEGIETNIRVAVNTWADGERVIRFFPSSWGDSSQIALVYYAETESSDKNGLRFYVNAYIDPEKITGDIESIKSQFIGDTDAIKYSWRIDEDEVCAWYEGKKNRVLALSVWPNDETKEGAMAVLADMALWVNKNAFS